jgi:HEPN domain-containing protein
LEIICYHSQQAVEKSPKAFSELALLCGSLTKYGIAPCYPYELEIADEAAKTALERAGVVSKFVVSKI